MGSIAAPQHASAAGPANVLVDSCAFLVKDPYHRSGNRVLIINLSPSVGAFPLPPLVAFNPLCRIKGASNLGVADAAARRVGCEMLPAARCQPLAGTRGSAV